MLKKILACSVVSLFILSGVGFVLASDPDPGPAEITIVGTKSKKPKPAIFPHKMHQDAFKCMECHHGMGEDGKQADYVADQKIEKCESCHNPEKLAGKTKGKLKLDTIKGAGHGKCVACHKAMEKEKPELKEKKISKCTVCHPKKKK